MSSLSAKLEAILFWKGEPEKVTRLAESVGEPPAAVREALGELETALEGRGLRLLCTDDEVALTTAPEAAEFIEAMRRDELSRDLGKAGAETLAVVLYKGPTTRAEIEYIRGVNCASILRSLMIRGLIEKIPSPEREKSFLYRASVELLTSLGVTKVEELPEYERARAEIDGWERAAKTAEDELDA